MRCNESRCHREATAVFRNMPVCGVCFSAAMGEGREQLRERQADLQALEDCDRFPDPLTAAIARAEKAERERDEALKELRDIKAEPNDARADLVHYRLKALSQQRKLDAVKVALEAAAFALRGDS